MAFVFAWEEHRADAGTRLQIDGGRHLFREPGIIERCNRWIRKRRTSFLAFLFRRNYFGQRIGVDEPPLRIQRDSKALYRGTRLLVKRFLGLQI